MKGRISSYILSDHREDTGAIPYIQPQLDTNNRNSIKLPWKSGGGMVLHQIVNNASIGDYAILVPSKHNPEKNVLAAVFERKTWKDLAASLKDQRAMTQHKNMLELQAKKGCMLYYIMEGGLTYQDTTKIARIPFKNLHAKMRSMSLKGVHSFQTRNQEDTARLLINLARDISRLYRNDKISFPKQEAEILGAQESTNPVEQLHTRLLQAVEEYKAATPQEDPIAKSLLDFCNQLGVSNVPDTPVESTSGNTVEIEAENLGTPNTFDMNNIDIPQELTTRPERRNDDIVLSMWCALPDVSSKSAPILMKEIKIADILTVMPYETAKMTDKITHMQYPSGAKFGRKRAERIMQVGYGGDDVTNKAIKKKLMIKVLSKIPRVTEEIARIILDNYSMQDVISGIFEDEIANLKRNNRRLGAGITKNIADAFS